MKHQTSTTRRLAGLMASCLLVTSCASVQAPALTSHYSGSGVGREHDESVSANGITDYYPNAADPQEIVLSGPARGGTNERLSVDIKCLSAGCATSTIDSMGSPVLPDGVYQSSKTNDPNIDVLRDKSGEQTLGYLAVNPHSHADKFAASPEEATAFEHQGDTARTIGKIALYTLAGVLIVGAVGAAAYEEKQLDTTTTTCNYSDTSSRCVTR